jgi:hypothetical protein
VAQDLTCIIVSGIFHPGMGLALKLSLNLIVKTSQSCMRHCIIDCVRSDLQNLSHIIPQLSYFVLVTSGSVQVVLHAALKPKLTLQYFLLCSTFTSQSLSSGNIYWLTLFVCQGSRHQLKLSICNDVMTFLQNSSTNHLQGLCTGERFKFD